MRIYHWRHSTAFSSWSMMEEPGIYKENYTQAEVAVLARSRKEAEQLLEESGDWNIEDVKKIEPEIILLEKPGILFSHVM